MFFRSCRAMCTMPRSVFLLLASCQVRMIISQHSKDIIASQVRDLDLHKVDCRRPHDEEWFRGESEPNCLLPQC